MKLFFFFFPYEKQKLPSSLLNTACFMAAPKQILQKAGLVYHRPYFFFHRRKLCKIFAFKYFIWFLMWALGPRKQLYRYLSAHLYFFARAFLQIFYSPMLEKIPTNSWNLLKYRAECLHWYVVHWLSLLKTLCIFILDMQKKFDILLG